MSAPYYQDEQVTVLAGDCLEVMAEMPAESVHAIVTDPPYGLANTTPERVADTIVRWVNGDRDYMPGGSGFMGKSWDAFVPPVAVWDECLRVLKPGGHLLAFAGSRTFDLMTLGVRLAGFEIRDSIAWLYGSGFPKSRDVTAAMESYLAGEAPAEEVYEVTAYLRAARDAAGWTNRQIDDLFGTNGMSGHWVSQGSQPAVPSLRQWAVLKESLSPHLGDEVDHLVERLAANERPEGWGSGDRDESFLGSLRKNVDYALAGGWGTALKPAFEPVVVARKPFAGTVASNVLEHGTGALNIDATRTATSDTDKAAINAKHAGMDPDSYVRKPGDSLNLSTNPMPLVQAQAHDAGRWPTNVLLDDTQAAELDKQSGEHASGGGEKAPRKSSWFTSNSDAVSDNRAPDSGGASRFFPTFRYEAKAPTDQRPRVNGIAHPTVKPLDLMRWLVRLVTPPGGTILDPFAGSGTTLEAALIEGFQCIGIERETDYLPLIKARITKPLEPVLDLGGIA